MEEGLGMVVVTLQSHFNQNEKWAIEEWDFQTHNNVLGINERDLIYYRVVNEESWMDKMKKMIPFSSVPV